MARAAGIDTAGMTPGEIKAVASWAAATGRTVILEAHHA
jgi:hypothetical protein